jgi:hypothetical protein
MPREEQSYSRKTQQIKQLTGLSPTTQTSPHQQKHKKKTEAQQITRSREQTAPAPAPPNSSPHRNGHNNRGPKSTASKPARKPQQQARIHLPTKQIGAKLSNKII